MTAALPIISAAAAGYQTRLPWGGSELVFFTESFSTVCGGPMGYLPTPTWAKRCRVALLFSASMEDPPGESLPFVIIERTVEQQPFTAVSNPIAAVLGTAINIFQGPIELELEGVERLVIISPQDKILMSFQFWG